jgi:hypothetical protein
LAGVTPGHRPSSGVIFPPSSLMPTPFRAVWHQGSRTPVPACRMGILVAPSLLLVRDPLPPPAHFSPPFQRSNSHPSRPPQLLLTRAFSSSRRHPSLPHTSARPFPLSRPHPSGPSNSVTPAPFRPLAVTHPSRTRLPAPFRSPDPIHPARPIPSHPRLLVLPPFPIARAHVSPPLSALQPPVHPARHTPFPHSVRAILPLARQAQRVPSRGCLLPPSSSTIPPQPAIPSLPALSEPHQHLRFALPLSLTTYQPVGMIFVKGETRCQHPLPDRMPG